MTMTKLDLFLAIRYLDDNFCQGAIRAAFADLAHGSISRDRLEKILWEAAAGRGCPIQEVWAFAERPALVLPWELRETIKANLLAAGAARPAQERADWDALIMLIRAMREAHSAGLAPGEDCPFLPALQSPCGLLILLDHSYGHAGDADTTYQLDMDGHHVLAYYTELLMATAKTNGLSPDDLAGIHRRAFHARRGLKNVFCPPACASTERLQ